MKEIPDLAHYSALVFFFELLMENVFFIILLNKLAYDMTRIFKHANHKEVN